MADLEANFTLEEQPTINATLSLDVTGITEHDLLIHRDYADQHPMTAISGLVDALTAKQNVLIAGTNIQINGDTISATDTTYVAGNGISIVGNVISNTQVSAVWGNITGSLSAQTDLYNELQDLDGRITSDHDEITNISLTMQTYGDIVTHDTSEFATAAEGALAASAVQPGENISILLNDAGYITLSALNGYATQAWVQSRGYLTEISYGDVTIALGFTPYDATNPAGYITSAALTGYATQNWVTNQGYITGITSTDVTTALGYTPYNSTNPAGYITSAALNGYATQNWVTGQGYITGIDSSDVTTALGYTPYDSANPAGYITSAALPTVNNSTITIQKNGTTVETFTLNQATDKTVNIAVPTDTSDLTNGAGFITSAAIPTLADLTTETQMAAINSGATSTNIGQIATNTQAISDETTNRQNADYNLQQQIDAITSASDVTDIVGTYAQLQAYDTTNLPNNSIIKVLQDESRNNETTYYRWVITNGTGTWVLIGEEGPYYTKSEADNTFVPQSRTVNGKALSANISLTASDVGAATSAQGALADTAVQPGDLATVATSGSYTDLTNKPTIPAAQIQSDWTQATTTAVDYIKNKPTLATVATSGSYNDLSNKPTIPSDTSDLTNGAGYITSSALSGYATETWVGNQGYLTGITSSDVTTALGYTPYNSSNPNGYITSSALTPYVLSTSLATVATSGSYNDLSNKPTIPAAQVNSDWNAASGVAQILNKPTIPTDTSDLTNGAGYITSSALSGYQTTSNLVTSISSGSTDTQYPSAKCVYDIVGDVESAINTIRGV